jgi:hypothetical protein
MGKGAECDAQSGLVSSFCHRRGDDTVSIRKQMGTAQSGIGRQGGTNAERERECVCVCVWYF